MVGAEMGGDLSSTIATIIVGLGTGLFGLHQYLKKPKEPSPNKEVTVVSASLFSDRPLLEQFIKSVECLTERLEETNELLRAENIDRQVETRVRAELRDRARKEKD